MKFGARFDKGSCTFTVWAPRAEKMEVRLLDPSDRLLPMTRLDRGYWQAGAEMVHAGSRYLLRLDGSRELPDPASFYQPEGVHGPSAVFDHDSFSWTDSSWTGRGMEELVLYELHVGTFTPEGTFAAIIPRLEELRKLGVSAIQVMPVAQFSGRWNWGYDAVFPFAVQTSYGGPEGLKVLVDACHRQGLAVILDVVYNHLGPEGNYLHAFGPYFSNRYRTPWGEAINFDGPDSDEVRHFFIENALYWYRNFHVDGLRLDAVHAIFDFSAKHFLRELTEQVERKIRRKGRICHLLAESDLNDVRVVLPPQKGGYGLDAQYHEDFHHALHTLLTGESQGCYIDFGRLDDLVKAYRQGFVYDWRYSQFRRRHHGSSSADLPARHFLAFIQNHDQVGNRLRGERLPSLVGFEQAKLAAAAVLFSPYIPLIFMGEEYAEEAPFLYFTDFTDQEIVEAIRKGRAEEFRAFDWHEAPPDPQDPEVFSRSRLNWSLRRRGTNESMLKYYARLLQLRRAIPALAVPERTGFEISAREEKRTIWFKRCRGKSRVFCLMNFNRDTVAMPFPRGGPDEPWEFVLDSASGEWRGPGSGIPPGSDERAGTVVMAPWSCQLYRG